MIVPRYWAEGRLQHRDEQRQVTVRRFGWSDVSEEDAQREADRRTREAFDRILVGEKLPRRDPKVPYNGADGVPIREEIISRHGETVVTRNLYGALCLNTPDVLFADVDFDERGVVSARWLIMVVVVIAAILGSVVTQSAGMGLIFGAVGLFVGTLLLAPSIDEKRRRQEATPEQKVLQRVEVFVARHRDWRIRVYRTPAGLRILALHRPFDPHEPAVAEFFKALGSDPIYVRMCLNQNCFRARISPKPWRIGIELPLRPRPGVWPVKPEHLPARARWITAYEKAAEDYASCRFLADYGGGLTHSSAREVQELHDDLCRAHSGLPIA